MPLYDFKCTKCEHVEEHFKKSDSPPVDVCSKCGAESTRMICAPAISYAGSKSFHQKVPDGFKDVLKGIKQHAPGGKEMKSSVI